MEKITIETIVHRPVKRVWQFFTEPEHIMVWNHASPDWHSPRAENHMEVGGAFNFRMEAVDGSEGFNFSGIYTEIVPHERIAYVMDGEDKREAVITFTEKEGVTHIVQSFDPEQENALEMQRAGWQAILDNFTKYSETHA